MATPINIKTPITSLQFTAIDTNSAAIEAILTLCKIDLTPAQIKGRLTVSVIKSSEIDDVNISLVKNNSKAASVIDIPTYEADILYLAELKQRQATMLQQYNEITTLVEVSQHNLMIKTNAILTNARIVAKTDQGVSDAMDVLDIKYFTHAQASPSVRHTIVPAGIMVLSGTNAAKTFTNTDKTILSILNVGGNIANAIRVNGFISVNLPRLWTNIVVTNLSTTDLGGFELFMK